MSEDELDDLFDYALKTYDETKYWLIVDVYNYTEISSDMFKKFLHKMKNIHQNPLAYESLEDDFWVLADTIRFDKWLIYVKLHHELCSNTD